MIYNVLMNNSEFVEKWEKLILKIDAYEKEHTKTSVLVQELLALYGEKSPVKKKSYPKCKTQKAQ